MVRTAFNSVYVTDPQQLFFPCTMGQKKRIQSVAVKLMILVIILSMTFIIQFAFGDKKFSFMVMKDTHDLFQELNTKFVNKIDGIDTNRSNQFPPIRLVNKPNCLQRKSGTFTLSDYDLPLTALASPWRSGNTWVRHLLQMATGIGTSALYCDKELRGTGFPFECSHDQFNRTLVVKSHEPKIVTHKRISELGQPFERVVLIIRDPYNYLVANNHRSHLDTATEDKYLRENTNWRRKQPQLLNWWNILNNYYLREFKGPVYPLLYSKLLLDTETELRRLLDFLRVEYTESDVKCAIDNKEGNFHRNSTSWTQVNDITELFNNSLRSEIDRSVRGLSDILERKYNVTWFNESHFLRVVK